MEFEELKDYSGFPCLIFSAAKNLGLDQTELLLEKLQPFLSTWESHGSPVQGSVLVRASRFLIVAHRPQEISGCGRDALLFRVQELGREIGVGWVGGGILFYRDDAGKVADADRAGFKTLARAGRITEATMVFDPTVMEVDGLLAGRFELPAGASWHARLLQPATTTV